MALHQTWRCRNSAFTKLSPDEAPPPPQLSEAPVRKMILQMHTPARTSQCWSQQTQHGLGVCIWMHLVNGTGNSPSPGQPTVVVKQDKSSRGSIDTTKTRSDPQRVRMSSGERRIGATKGKQPDTEALCQPPPPPPLDALDRALALPQ